MMLGTPEFDLLDMMHRDIHEYYGVPWTMKLVHTSAPLPNAQAQIERSVCATLGVLEGYTYFVPIGQIAVDEVWSAAQTVLDIDIISHARRVAKGVESGTGLDLGHLAEVIDEVVREGGLFAQHESTVANFRTQYHQPRILERLTLAQWLDQKQPDVVLEAQRRAEELVVQHEYEPSQDILRELKRIYEKGKEQLLR
jgi:trimethylamine:corrinoid methyltransferase-like protein